MSYPGEQTGSGGRGRGGRGIALGWIVLRGTLAVCVAALIVGLVTRGGVAAVPPGFDAGLSLTEASAASGRSGRPVLVLATADWCGPCQAFKRGALVDERVTELVRATTEPVFLNVDVARDDAAALQVFSIPALILVRDGKVLSRLEGNRGAADFLQWLGTAGGQGR